MPSDPFVEKRDSSESPYVESWRDPCSPAGVVFVRRRPPLSLLALAASLAPSLGACTSTYHPEYHPESSYKYVQNVVYAQNLVVKPQDPKTSPIDLEMAAPYLDLWGRQEFRKSGGAPPSQPPGPRGKVSSDGGMVIYGDVYGDIFFNR